MSREQDSQMAEQVALFRYGLIADLAQKQPGERGMYALLVEKAKHDYEIPGTLRRRVAAETMRGWLRMYREKGFDGLKPRPRCDMGRARAIPQEAADLLCGIKEDRPALSVADVIEAARGGLPADLVMAPATVHRLLSRAGLMEKRPKEPTSKDHRRFQYERANELWMSDVMHGPSVVVEGRRKRKAYLIALLDDATRVVPYSAFALSENVAAFLPVMLQAIRRRGLPLRLYVDNGSAYRSRQLALVCAKLGITLIHARPYQPAGKGKQERWFRTVRMQLLPTLTEADLGSLEALNRRLWAWVEGEYHQSPHKGLDGETPLDRWAVASTDVKLVGPATDLDDLSLFEEKRKVQKDRTVSLHGVAYEADAALVDETVTLRFDPSRRGRPIQVWHKGKLVHVAKPVDVYANCFVKRDHGSKLLQAEIGAPAPAPGLRLRDLDDTDQEGGR